ncbi:Arc family DNA-binding protein [Acinetobacter sp. YH12123]|uniref:Arc family DNA-binding protein n=1 Tax=Acinetobacter sp. YH12123 TaxID=2601108 RepID=UPI0015D0FDE7|nr:Arc family DNA-binding protein [Acinetobacter sp. YH12123]
MSNQADHTIVRLRVPPELKQKIEESAEKNNRSQSAEMVARLEQSFSTHSGTHELNDFLEMFKNMNKQNQEIQKQLMGVVRDQSEVIEKLKSRVKKE